MKLNLFSIGFSSLSFEGAIQMMDSMKGSSERTIQDIIDDPCGFPIYAAGVHIAHFWLTTLSLEVAQQTEMFLRLASKDPSFLSLEGEIP